MKRRRDRKAASAPVPVAADADFAGTVSGKFDNLGRIGRPHVGTCFAAAALVVLVSACNAIPKDGPFAGDVSSGASVKVDQPTQSGEYAVVGLGPDMVRLANASTTSLTPAFSSFVTAHPSEAATLAPGDIVQLTIFEATTGGLFFPPDQGGSSRQGNYVQIPNQQIDAAGYIDAPFAGKIRAAGHTPLEVASDIQQRLSQRAIEPQVIVSVVDRRSGSVSVLGEANLPQRFALDPGGVDILGAIARAGGPKFPAYETLVTLKRGAEEQQATLANIVAHPEQDVRLAGGDTVFLAHKPRTFIVLGATPSPGSVGGINNRRFTFDDDDESLVEALAKAGGLDDNRADPRFVYLFRLELRDTLKKAGVPLTNSVPRIMPTVYTVSLARPDGFFLSNGFLMRSGDVIFVPNAPIPDLNKYLAVLQNLGGPLYNFTGAANSAYGIR